MTDYTQKDIERVCRLGQVSRIKAIELLRRYGGKPERVMTEHFGRARVYIEPLCVCDIKAEQTQRLKHAAVADARSRGGDHALFGDALRRCHFGGLPLFTGWTS